MDKGAPTDIRFLVRQVFRLGLGRLVEVYPPMASANRAQHATFSDVGVSHLLNRATVVDFRTGTGFNPSRDG